MRIARAEPLRAHLATRNTLYTLSCPNPNPDPSPNPAPNPSPNPNLIETLTYSLYYKQSESSRSNEELQGFEAGKTPLAEWEQPPARACGCSLDEETANAAREANVEAAEEAVLIRTRTLTPTP